MSQSFTTLSTSKVLKPSLKKTHLELLKTQPFSISQLPTCPISFSNAFQLWRDLPLSRLPTTTTAKLELLKSHTATFLQIKSANEFVMPEEGLFWSWQCFLTFFHCIFCSFLSSGKREGGDGCFYGSPLKVPCAKFCEKFKRKTKGFRRGWVGESRFDW